MVLNIVQSKEEEITPFYVLSWFIKIQDEQGWCVYLQKHEILRDMVDHHKQSTNTQTDRMHRLCVPIGNAF